MLVEEYVHKYNLLNLNGINCEYVQFMIYMAFINKFVYEITQEEYYIFELYHSKIRKFVEDLREKNINFINNVLKYINDNTMFMIDIVLMQWSLPNNDLLSKSNYIIDYKNKIDLFNKKLNLLDKNIIDNACKRMLHNNKSFPIHCIDLLWNFISTCKIDFVFINDQSANYITIAEDTENITMSVNIEYLVYLGLGCVINNYNKTFKEFIFYIIDNKELCDYFKTSHSGKNFKKQCDNLLKMKN